MTAFPNQTIGDYTLVEPVGSGGMGEVYRAVHARIGREVAIKIMTGAFSADSAFERFRNEARVHSSLSHPNIATLFEFYEMEGRACIVMEYVDGQTLSDRIRTTGRIGVDEAVAIFRKVLGAVDYIHQCEIIHRDIKSNNIKITTRHDIKLLDFGIAKAPFTSNLTHDGSLIGTMEYLAPEQIQGKPATVQSDIWALGVLLYEMITGRPPFQSESLPELCDKIITGGYTPPSVFAPEIPPALENIIDRCLKKKAGNRYPSVGQIIRDMDDQMKNKDGPSVSGTMPQIGEFFLKIKDYWLVVALVLVIVFGIIALIIPSRPDNSAVQPDHPTTVSTGSGTEKETVEKTLTSRVRIDVRQGEPADITIRGKNGEIGSGTTPFEFDAPVDSHIELELRRNGYRIMKRSIIVHELGSRNVYTYVMCREGDEFCQDD